MSSSAPVQTRQGAQISPDQNVNPSENVKGPILKLQHFSGPLELLYYLVESQKIDLYDIPISMITEQYLDYLRQAGELNMDLASEFLVMAATLIQIKARMLLPRPKPGEAEDDDPRGDLVLKLLEYRRCRLLADFLRDARESRIGCYSKLPSSPAELGVELREEETSSSRFRPERFQRAAEALRSRNTMRFNDLSEHLRYILKREKVSLVAKLKQIWVTVRRRTKFYFTELFPFGASRTERVTGFLAVLELLRSGRIEVRQDQPFAAMELSLSNQGGDEKTDDGSDAGDRAFTEWLEREDLGEKDHEYGD